MIIMDEQKGISFRRWRPARLNDARLTLPCRQAGVGQASPRAALLLVHGLGGHGSRWEFLADYFTRRDIVSYAIELKGFGETKTLPGHIGSFNEYFRDISALREIIRKEEPGKKIFIVGESLGGLLVFLLAADEPGFFDGLICISPAFKSKLSFPAPKFIDVIFSVIFNPTRQFNMPFNSAMATQDEVYLKVMDADPREHRLATASLLVHTAFAMRRAQRVKGRVAGPVLFLLADDNDMLVDTITSKRIFAGLGCEDKKLVQYPGMRHALSIEKDREKVFEEMLRWLEKRI